MSFRSRFVGAISMVILVTLAVAFAAVFQFVKTSQERQLDDALQREARQEVSEISVGGGERLRIVPRLSPQPDDIGPMTKYAVLYDESGQVLDATAAWKGRPPKFDELAPLKDDIEASLGDLELGEQRLRAVIIEVPNYSGRVLLLAASRTDLDHESQFLIRVMGLVFMFAILVTIVLTSGVVRQLTQVHARIALVARRVSAKDLTARVGEVRAAPEIMQLARDIDDMIEQIDVLLRNQADFVAHAAHELRSPLTTLYGELSHALRRSRGAEEYRAAIDEALSATRRLMTLADDLLTLARIGRANEPEAREVDLAEVIQEAYSMVVGEATARGVRIELDVEPVSVCGSASDLVRLVRNLLENAIGHSPPDSAVELQCQSTSKTVLLRVRDHGGGIVDDDAERVFQPFFRGSRDRASDRPGTGLGLAIARDIAKRHHGSLDLQTVDGPGACFLVALPRRSGS